jgi:enamine deaminase RidA (YjgF/YER057c/UK114 family)
MSEIIRRTDSTPTEHAEAAPWMESVEVPAGARWLFLSGQVPPIIDPQAGIETRAAYGNMERQTRGVMRRIEEKLAQAGFGLGDIVKMNAFLVADDGPHARPDLDGFGRVYREYFGTSKQPLLPARSRIQIVKLMNPAWLVEIEVIAAKMLQSNNNA